MINVYTGEGLTMERTEKITDEQGDLIVRIGNKYTIKEMTSEVSRDDWRMFITLEKREHETGIKRKSSARRRYIGWREKNK